MRTPFDFSGQVVLVTGGTRGIGLAITQSFLAGGADVVVCGRKSPEQPITANGAPNGKSAVFVSADVRDPEQVTKLAAEIRERFGRLDVAINNAGGSPPSDSATASARFSESIVRLNLLAPFYVSQAAHGLMQAQDSGGLIINIASVSAVRPSPFTTMYGAAKAGLISMSKSLAIEWAPKIRVNTIIVGLINTEESAPHYGGEEGVRKIAATIPSGRFGTPDDVAGMCIFLASPLASFVNGTALEVHGGLEVPRYLEGAMYEKSKKK